jgi:hypothetical protein
VVLGVHRDFAGDWSLKTALAYDKMNASRMKFILPLKVREKR